MVKGHIYFILIKKSHGPVHDEYGLKFGHVARHSGPCELRGIGAIANTIFIIAAATLNVI